MRAGKVELLLVAGANPVYDAPASLKFAEALAKVPFVVSLNDRLDETSLLADLLAPVSHPFECWGDATLPKGLFAVQQPVIQPLFDTRGLLDVLVEWGAAAGDPAALAAVTAASAAAAKAPVPATAAPAPSPSVAWHYLRAAWARAPRRSTRDAGVRDGVERGAARGRSGRPAARGAARRPRRFGAPGRRSRSLARRCSPRRRRLGGARAAALPAPRAGGRARRATTAGSTSSPTRSPASPGAGRCRSRRAASTR